jgi:AraC-like DNA-binding protein
MPTSAFSSFRFSTRGMAPKERRARWNEASGRPLSRRLLAPPWHCDGPFHLEMRGHRFGGSDSGPGTSIMRIEVSAGGVAHRTSELIADGNDDVILHIHETGHRIVRQLGREAETHGGMLTSNADRSTIVLPRPSRFISIAVPRPLIRAMVPGIEDAFMRPLPPGHGVLRLLSRYLAVLDEDDALGTPELRQAFAAHVHDLCALAAGATRDAAELAKGRGLRAARLAAIKADISEHLADEGLRATTIALRHGITPRYLHKLFEGEGTTLSQFVRGQRLARVHRALGDPGAAHRTIGELAYDAGFGDLSTFNRYFRRQFGMTPSDVRADAARSDGR